MDNTITLDILSDMKHAVDLLRENGKRQLDQMQKMPDAVWFDELGQMPMIPMPYTPRGRFLTHYEREKLAMKRKAQKDRKSKTAHKKQAKRQRMRNK